MTASASCTSFGVPFHLTADSGPLLAQMIDRTPHSTEVRQNSADHTPTFTVSTSPPSSTHQLRFDGTLIAEDPSLDTILDIFARDLMVHVANHAPDRVFVHAGVVAWQGRALLLPGASHAGKTTLVAALVRAGATYFSDEYAILDPQALVHPYPRALQMRAPGSDRQTSVTVEDLNGSTGSQALPASHVIFCEYAKSGRWNPQPVSPGIAVLQMLPHAIPIQRAPARVMATLAKVMESATALHSLRGEATEAAQALLATISRSEPAV